MLATLARLAAQNSPGPESAPALSFDFSRNPYKAKQTWPPDFSKLSEKHQFRLERRYRRRAKLKWARPRLMVATKLAQWIGGAGVLTYGLLFMDWGDDGEAFKGLRSWYRETMGSLFGRRRPTSQPGMAQRQSGAGEAT